MFSWFKGLSAAIRIGIVLVVIIAALLTVSMCSRPAKEQAKQDTRSAEAIADTANDAAETVIQNAAEDASIDELVAATQLEIDNAPNEKVSRAAAVRAICRMPVYSNHPDCEL